MSATVATAELPAQERKRSLTWRVFGGRADPVLIASALVLLLLLLWGIVPALFATHNPNKIGPDLLQAPSRSYWFGTDEYGRDI
jgi:peptide/nickel transport system permease protein